MLYCGNRNDSIYHATSSDGVQWTKNDTAIFKGYAPNILRGPDGLLWLFSIVKPLGKSWEISLAKGTDWDSLETIQTVLVSNTQAWEHGNLFYPYVLYEGGSGGWTLSWSAYSDPAHTHGGQPCKRDEKEKRCYPTTAIGLAHSADGLHWTKCASNPILEPVATSPYDATYVGSPSLLTANAAGSLLPQPMLYYAARINQKHKYFSIAHAVGANMTGRGGLDEGIQKIPHVVPSPNDRAVLLQREIDAAIRTGQPAIVQVSGTYNFSRASLAINGAHNLTLQPAPDCIAPGCVPLMLFSLWPCGESLGQDAPQCRPIDFSNPTVTPTCKALNGTSCACPDVIWSSGVNISNSADVTVRGITIDYSPRSLPPTTCKPGPIPPPPAPDSPTPQFNSGRKFSYNIFNSSRVVTEGLTIRSAPFMAITSYLGDGAHVFRRVAFAPNPRDFNAMIAGKDGLHESDVRVGLKFIDSKIHGTADDFFNFHNTLHIVFRCDAPTHSCLIANPHINGVPLNTVYGSQRVLTTVRVGDRFSFYPITHQHHPEDSVPPLLATMSVVSKQEVEDAVLLAQARVWAQQTASNKTNGLMAFGDGSDLWNFTFAVNASVDFSALPQNTLVNIDSISGAGAEIRDCDFSVTACNLGRTKSSNSTIANTTFSKAKDSNLEVTGLQIWFEGPIYISNISIVNNTFVGEGPQGSVIHVSKASSDVHESGNRYITAINPSAVEANSGVKEV